jgi:gluconolactonase
MLPAIRLLMLALALRAAFGQDFSGIQVVKVSANHRFTEGPAWSQEGYLLFSDVPGNRILKFTPGEGVSTARENANGASGNAFDSQGRLYTCETRTRRVIRMDKRGRVEVLADKWEGKRLNAPNDIVVRRDGQVYFTDPAFGAQSDARELDFYGVYHITPKGELSVIAKPKGRPNGVALSAHGRVLYVTNSDDRTVSAYDLDRQGAASNERVLIGDIPGVPGGLRLDEKGNLYVASQGVCVYSPAGKRIAFIEMQDAASNLAFGDEDLQSLYITARTSVYRVRLDVKGAVQH